MLGIAIDRDFATNGYLYLLYVYELNPTPPDTDAPMVSRLTRVTVKPDNTLENPADPETVILGKDVGRALPDPGQHASTASRRTTTGTRSAPCARTRSTARSGSGAATRTRLRRTHPSYRTYDEQSFAGKIIHIDRRGAGLPDHPFCPADTNLDHVCTKIYAKGFRNPFRFTCDRARARSWATSAPSAGRRSTSSSPGGNYGWPCYEGTVKPSSRSATAALPAGVREGGHRRDAATPAELGATTTTTARRSSAGRSTTGRTYPADYRGDIFVGDYVQGWIKRLEVDANDQVTAVHDFADVWTAGVDLEMHPNGDLSVRGHRLSACRSRRVTRFTTRQHATAARRRGARRRRTPARRRSACSSRAATRAIRTATTLTYDWDFGDGSPHSDEADPTHTYEPLGNYTARLTVTDDGGERLGETVPVTVDSATSLPRSRSNRPGGRVALPGRREVTLRGSGYGSRGRRRSPAARSSGHVLLHHNTHVHDPYGRRAARRRPSRRSSTTTRTPTTRSA